MTNWKADKEYRIARELFYKRRALNMLADSLRFQELYVIMELDENGEMVTVTDLMSKSERKVSVWGDNIKAMLTDVLNAISDWN